MSKPKRLTKQVIWRRKSMKTAIPANREKVWTAGITDKAPAGEEGRHHFHFQQRALSSLPPPPTRLRSIWTQGARRGQTYEQTPLLLPQKMLQNLWRSHQNWRRVCSPEFFRMVPAPEPLGELKMWLLGPGLLLLNQDWGNSTPLLMYLIGSLGKSRYIKIWEPLILSISYRTFYASLQERDCIFHLLVYQQYRSSGLHTIKWGCSDSKTRLRLTHWEPAAHGQIAC